MSESDQSILLDTSVLIDFAEVQSALPEEADASISAISLAELAAGIHASKDPVRQAERQLQFRWVVQSFEPLVFDAETAHVYGSLAFLVQQIGRKPRGRVADLQIAATAVQHALPLYTRNPDDFKGLGPLLNVIPL
ncbi:type II toxin-antitoxin system VapC family toxin [Nocardia cyriacigeorgica]|uniref:type II toxin-antitoxin system VapC family toxin n=1 Tax=Nocardia cyriacigeorgica TaxID=135487 RepID=UPI001894CE50|nr:type II toxin-antitoxin system VapC family toxin [Nocardia cyriacigeorgica]MBF6100938.1 type II toxin-antitoxin system VapC family toxin [Nocardia cyriacigeorgica]MBF6160396.1 type II toxin-antitoxin system VapC family toxin [Nocardia cyriacigeorgica]MBF6199481.1 type II toxin-antitoxin system VapC family toxin [Nocardia cyriacigeorgica]MBF6515787.1 type II toxin-antitoxin system VapC family toxin [Nocardia cyriacigeorgica]